MISLSNQMASLSSHGRGPFQPLMVSLSNHERQTPSRSSFNMLRMSGVSEPYELGVQPYIVSLSNCAQG